MDKNVKKSTDAAKSEVGKTVVGGTAAGVAESAAEQAINQVVPTRAAVNQAVSDGVRKVPILGDVIDMGQKAGYLGHLAKMFGGRKKKKSDKES